MERLTLAGFKARTKVIIQAKRQCPRLAPVQGHSPLLSQFTPVTDDTVVIRNLDTGLELDLALENLQEFPKALAVLTESEVGKAKLFGEERRHVNRKLMEAVRSNDVTTCEEMLDSGDPRQVPNIDSRFDDNLTALHYAASLGFTQLVLVLIHHHANLEARNTRLQTPMHLAASNGHAETVQALAEAGANVNCGDADLWTPLHYAANSSYWSVATALLTHSADLGLKNTEGLTPYELVRRDAPEGKKTMLDVSISSVETHELSMEKEADWRKKLMGSESTGLLAVHAQ